MHRIVVVNAAISISLPAIPFFLQVEILAPPSPRTEVKAHVTRLAHTNDRPRAFSLVCASAQSYQGKFHLPKKKTSRETFEILAEEYTINTTSREPTATTGPLTLPSPNPWHRLGRDKMAHVDYALFESPVGYALFNVVHQSDAVGLKLKEVQAAAIDLSKFGKMVKLINFTPFRYLGNCALWKLGLGD